VAVMLLYYKVHDVVMAVGDTLEEVYPQLKQAWFGEAQGLHIDAWAKLSGVSSQGQNYQIHFTDAAPQPDDLKLYLINLGGYMQVNSVNFTVMSLWLHRMR
jgi:hypothetical protein